MLNWFGRFAREIRLFNVIEFRTEILFFFTINLVQNKLRYYLLIFDNFFRIRVEATAGWLIVQVFPWLTFTAYTKLDSWWL